MSALQSEFRKLMAEGLDISEHLGLLKGLASDDRIKKVVEFGFRTGVSATALCASGKPVISYDIKPHTAHVDRLKKLAPKFSFVMASSLAGPIPKCDFLHIDSEHTYAQLKSELMMQSPNVRLWIAMHDTATFGQKGQDGSSPGLMEAIRYFLNETNNQWKLKLHLQNNNGFTLLERPTSP